MGNGHRSNRALYFNDQCGNRDHPDGGWHLSTTLPVTIADRIRQWWRRRKYGCGCPVGGRTQWLLRIDETLNYARSEGHIDTWLLHELDARLKGYVSPRRSFGEPHG